VFRLVVCTLWTLAVLLALPAVPAYTYEEVSKSRVLESTRLLNFGLKSFTAGIQLPLSLYLTGYRYRTDIK